MTSKASPSAEPQRLTRDEEHAPDPRRHWNRAAHAVGDPIAPSRRRIPGGAGPVRCPVSCQKPARSAPTRRATVSLIFSKKVAGSRLEATCRDICVSESSPRRCALRTCVDKTRVAQCEDGEQADLLEPIELVRDKRTVASPAQDQHCPDGLAQRTAARSRCGASPAKRGVSVGVRGAAFAEAAAQHDRARGHRLIQQRLPRQPGQRIFVSDEVGWPAALIARLDAEHVLVEARQRAAIDVDVFGGEADEAFHDLVRVAEGDDVRFDRPGEIGRRRWAGIDVRGGRARCQSRQAPEAEGCHGRQEVADI